MEHQAITEKLHSHILRLRRKQQLNGRYRLREYQVIGLTYLCQIENIDTKIVETLLVKHKDII
nr:MAG TPA: hypothetical protein [Caudoviricetes sp.]